MTEKERGRRKKAAAAPQAEPDLHELTRRVLLAGMGAAALAYDEAKAFLDHLVERGELAQEQARAMLKEVSQKHEGRMQKARGRVQDRLARVRETLDVPSREDIANLQQRLDRLSERLEALLQQRPGQD